MTMYLEKFTTNLKNMKRLLKNWFELYSILACIIVALPLIIIALY